MFHDPSGTVTAAALTKLDALFGTIKQAPERRTSRDLFFRCAEDRPFSLAVAPPVHNEVATAPAAPHWGWTRQKEPLTMSRHEAGLVAVPPAAEALKLDMQAEVARGHTEPYRRGDAVFVTHSIWTLSQLLALRYIPQSGDLPFRRSPPNGALMIEVAPHRFVNQELAGGGVAQTPDCHAHAVFFDRGVAYRLMRWSYDEWLRNVKTRKGVAEDAKITSWEYIDAKGRRNKDPIYLAGFDELERFAEAARAFALERPVLTDIKGRRVTILPAGYPEGVAEPPPPLPRERLSEIVDRARRPRSLKLGVAYLDALAFTPASSRSQQANRFACFPVLDAADVNTRLSSVSDDAVVTEYAARKRQEADQLFGLQPIAQFDRPCTRAIYSNYLDVDRVAHQPPDEEDGQRLDDEELCLDDKERRLRDDKKQCLRDIEDVAGSPLTRAIILGGSEEVTILGSDAATPCANREKIVADIERLGIENSRLQQSSTLEMLPGSWSQPPGPFELFISDLFEWGSLGNRFTLATIGERIQRPAAIQHIRDFGDVEDQTDPADAHSAFGDEAARALTGQRPIVGAETKCASDKAPARLGEVVRDLFNSGASVRDLPGHHRAPRLSDEPADAADPPNRHDGKRQRDIAKRAAEELHELGCADTHNWFKQAEAAIRRADVQKLRDLGCRNANEWLSKAWLDEQKKHLAEETKPAQVRPLPKIAHPELERALAGVRHGDDRHKINKRFREVRKNIIKRPAYFAELLAEYQKLTRHKTFDRKADARAIEAQSWIVKPWQDAAIEEARKAVLCWQRAGKPEADAALRQQVALYADAVAKRLNAAAGPERFVRAKNNGHLSSPDRNDLTEAMEMAGAGRATTERLLLDLGQELAGTLAKLRGALTPAARVAQALMNAQTGDSVDLLLGAMLRAITPPEPSIAERLLLAMLVSEPTVDWTPPAVPSFHLDEPDSYTLIRGIENIAEALGREPNSILRSARKGKLPIAELDGELVMPSSMIGADEFATAEARKRNEALAFEPPIPAPCRKPKPPAKPARIVKKERSLVAAERTTWRARQLREQSMAMRLISPRT